MQVEQQQQPILALRRCQSAKLSQLRSVLGAMQLCTSNRRSNCKFDECRVGAADAKINTSRPCRFLRRYWVLSTHRDELRFKYSVKYRIDHHLAVRPVRILLQKCGHLLSNTDQSSLVHHVALNTTTLTNPDWGASFLNPATASSSFIIVCSCGLRAAPHPTSPSAFITAFGFLAMTLR